MILRTTSAACSSIAPTSSTASSSPPGRPIASLPRTVARNRAGDLREHFVAGLVAVLEVDPAQPDDVEQRERQLLVAAARGRDLVGDRLLERAARHRAAQRIVQARREQPLALGDDAGDGWSATTARASAAPRSP